MAVLHSVEVLLERSKWFVNMLIAGIDALIMLLANTTAASVSLVKSIHTATYVNSLSHNLLLALKAQENWDYLIEQKLHALQDTIYILKDQIYTLEVRSTLNCHALYNHICVTPYQYNESVFPWDRVKKSFDGV